MECHVYWLMKSSCFKLSGEEKYGLFWAKKLYLLIIGKFLFWTFPRWEIRVFLAKKLMERRYLLITEKALFWTFWRWKNGFFFEPKSWWKDDIYLVFLSFPWYSRAWEIWYFMQWQLTFRVHSKNDFTQPKFKTKFNFFFFLHIKFYCCDNITVRKSKM